MLTETERPGLLPRTCRGYVHVHSKRPGFAIFVHTAAEKQRLEHLTLEMLAYGRQKPAFSHFVARIFKKILAEQLTHFIR
ncbi:MAG: hypothetical protein DESF_01559 [Desulfovibrio sp.]